MNQKTWDYIQGLMDSGRFNEAEAAIRKERTRVQKMQAAGEEINAMKKKARNFSKMSFKEKSEFHMKMHEYYMLFPSFYEQKKGLDHLRMSETFMAAHIVKEYCK